MKKAIAVVLALILAFSLVACGKSATEKSATDTGNNQTSNAPASSNPTGTTTTPTNPNAPSNETSELTAGTGEFTPSDEVLRIAHKGNPTGMCVLNIAAVSNNNPCMICLYDQLVSYDYVTKEVGPEIATEWKYLDDTHIEFTLRDDVYSHAGDHLTASDVIFSVKTAIDSTKLTKYYDCVDFDECKVIDDTHVVLATKYVNPFFLMSLSNTPMSIIVEASVQKLNIDTPDLGDIGEIMMESIQSDESIDYILEYKTDYNEFTFESEAVKKELEGVSLLEPEILLWIKDYINQGIEQAKEDTQ